VGEAGADGDGGTEAGAACGEDMRGEPDPLGAAGRWSAMSVIVRFSVGFEKQQENIAAEFGAPSPGS